MVPTDASRRGQPGVPGEGFSHRSHQGGEEQPQGERRKEPGHQPDQSGSQQHAGQDAPELSRAWVVCSIRIPPSRWICFQYTAVPAGL